MTYAKYPLDEIRPGQAQTTFVRDLLPEVSQYEFKMLKYLFKSNNARLIKAIKSYNYERMQRLETGQGESKILFYTGTIEQMSRSLEN